MPVTPDARSSGGGGGSKRHQSRALAVQALYASEVKSAGDAAGELEHLLISEPVDKEVESYARKLLQAVSAGDTKDAADEAIQSVLSSWTLERVTPVERCILRVGLAELKTDLGVPPIVAIDEAIRLAKEFGTKNSEKFVNGVLDAIYKKKKQPS